MANWNKLSTRGSVSDRRGMSSAGLGVFGTLMIVGVTYLLGGDPLATLFQLQGENLSNPMSEEERAAYEGMDEYENFSSLVLGSLNDYWSSTLSGYRAPTLVLFRGSTTSSCGGASSFAGPHYCPTDESIYLDETFFEELQSTLGAQGGDVAEAYVIAHEVGHHVQNISGLLNGGKSSENSIQIELMADCFAGAWLGALADEDIYDESEVLEALDAASAVGDDNIQRRSEGVVQPETWTHGSSADRKEAFTLGYENPDEPGLCQEL